MLVCSCLYYPVWAFILLVNICFSLDAAEGGGAAAGEDEAPAWRARPLVRTVHSSLASPDIGSSPLYAEGIGAGPLKVVLMHSYNPIMPHGCIALRLHTTAADYPTALQPHIRADAETFLVMDRPILTPTAADVEPALLRPHYWVYRHEAGKFNKNKACAIKLLKGEAFIKEEVASVHAHDGVCSPANMVIPGGLGEESIIYSLVTPPDGGQVLTCHCIPSEARWALMSDKELGAREETVSSTWGALADSLSLYWPEGDATLATLLKLLAK